MTRTTFVSAAIFSMMLLVGCSGDEKQEQPAPTITTSQESESAAVEIPFPDTTEMESRVVSALQDAKQRVADDRDSAMAWGNLGAILDAHFLLDDAAAAYRQACSLAPDVFDWQYHLAHVMLANAEPAPAVTAQLRRAASLAPNYAPVFWHLGSHLMTQQQFADAAVMFGKALDADPSMAIAQRDLGRCLLKADDARKAVGPLAQALASLPSDSLCLTAMIDAYKAIGKTQSVAVLAERLKGAEPVSNLRDPLRDKIRMMGVSSAICSERAGALLRQGRYEEAARDFLIAAQARPKDAAVQLGLGRAYLYAGSLDKAQFHLQNALRLDPELAPAHMELGQIMMARREASPAAQHFRTAIRLDPEEGLAYAQLGAALLAGSSFRESNRAFEKAAELTKLSGEMESNWASTLALIDQPEAAIEHYERAIEKQPDFGQAHFGIGYVLQHQNEYAAAIPHFIAALQINPAHVDAMTYLGLCHQRVGRLTDAFSIYRAALRLEPNLPLGPNMDALENSIARRKAAGVTQPPFDRGPEFELMAKRLLRYEPKYLGHSYAEQLKEQINKGDLVLHERINVQIDLAQSLLQIGDVDGAVEAIESAFLAADQTDGYEPSPPMHFLRGLVFMRKAEVQNCIDHHNEDSCIFPLTDGGVHVNPEPARTAAASFTKYLQLRPDDLGARWLLNVTYMMQGAYPDKVPNELLVRQDAHAADVPFPRFRDIAPALGIAPFDLCGGVVIDDLDGDDRLDIVTSTFDPSGPLSCFRRDSDGSFTDLSDASRLSEQRGGLNIIGGDYDNDGDTDLLVLRGAWMYDAGKLRNSLLQNDGNGVFTDVTFEAGLAFPAYPTQTAAWADFDNDGDLDLYIGNESRVEIESGAVNFPNQLFINQGDGTFVDVAEEAGVTNDRYCKGVAAGDYDNDGDMDLYVSNNSGNRLYRNNGDLSFTDVTQEAGVWEPVRRSFATWFFDYDNDGWLDIFVGGFSGTVADVAADYLGLAFQAEKPRLYHNNGDGTFTDKATEAGLNHVYMPMGAGFGDLDYDGYLDIYLSTGDPSFETLVPNVMLRNDNGRGFQDVTIAGGFGHAQKGHGVSFADLDQDGDQDIYNQLGGFYPGDRFSNVLFENPGSDNHFLVLVLEGQESNRAAIGARVHVVVETPEGERSIHRAAGSVSSFGGTPRRLEIGLGTATSIKRVAVTWPGTGKTQIFDSLASDSAWRMTEGSDEVEKLPFPEIPFPAGAHEHAHHH